MKNTTWVILAALAIAPVAIRADVTTDHAVEATKHADMAKDAAGKAAAEQPGSTAAIAQHKTAAEHHRKAAKHHKKAAEEHEKAASSTAK